MQGSEVIDAPKSVFDGACCLRRSLVPSWSFFCGHFIVSF